MKLLFAFVIATAAMINTAHASYLERCEFTAKVLSKTVLAVADGQNHRERTPVVIVRITSSKDLGSHYPTACASHKKNLRALQLTSEEVRSVEVDQVLKLGYFFVSNMSPEGVFSSSRWTVLK